MSMRQVDVVLSVLTLIALGMGLAAYRAWHPDVTEPVSDTSPVRSPAPVAAARTVHRVAGHFDRNISKRNAPGQERTISPCYRG